MSLFKFSEILNIQCMLNTSLYLYKISVFHIKGSMQRYYIVAISICKYIIFALYYYNDILNKTLTITIR